MRTYKRKTNRGTKPRETYMKAATEVLAKTNSLRKASAKYPINFITLQRFCKKLEAGSGVKCYIFKFLAFILEVKFNKMNCAMLLSLWFQIVDFTFIKFYEVFI
jgi:hypothetical protein